MSVVHQGGYRFAAKESITVAATSIGLTAATLVGYKYALVTCETAAVRFWLDSTAPSATVGHVLEPNDILQLYGPELASVRFIRRDGTSATLRVSYGRHA